jgi:uncharacterized membrane protein YqjE
MAHSDARGMGGADEAFSGQGFRSGDATGRGGTRDGSSESVGTLISGLIKDIQDLLRGEIQLAKTELKEDASAAGKGIGYLIAGGLIGLIALVFVALAASALLDKWMQTWIAVAIVAVALAVIAAILAMSGKSKLNASNLKPEQTIESLKEDKEWAQQQISSVKR